MSDQEPGLSSVKYTYGAVADEQARRCDFNASHKLNRTLSSFATFGLAFTNIGILSNTSATFQTVLQRGGPSIMLLSWNLVSGFMICVALSLAEICSLYPTSGGLYYWVYELLHSPSGNNRKAAFIAFVTGWIYTLANIISIGATNVTVALSLGSIVKIAFGLALNKLALTLLTIAVTLVHGGLNVYELRGLVILNKLSVFWTCVGLVAVVLILSLSAQHQDLSWVLTDYENQTGFDNPVYVVVLGMIGAAYSLFGCECAASVSEETKEADLSSPLAMTMSIVISWFVGLGFLITLLFSIQDMEAILTSSLDMPVAQLFWDAVGAWGTVCFLTLLVVCQFCTGAATTTVTSRQVYALARDGASPMSARLSSLNEHQIPTSAVWATTVLACLVVAPFPLSEHVFEIIVSTTTITMHLAYAIVLGCRLCSPWPTRKGRFSLGRWTFPITCFGFGWTVFAVGAFTLPTAWPIQVENANYAGFGLLLVVMTTCLFWQGWGRHHYIGPRARVDM